MDAKNVLRFTAFFSLCATLSGCVDQVLFNALADATTVDETPESLGETPANYRGKSCLELAVARERHMISVNHMGDHAAYVQQVGRWGVAAVQQVEREQGCLAGATSTQVAQIEYVKKHPESAKEFNLPPGALQPTPHSAAPANSAQNATASTSVSAANSALPAARGWLGASMQKTPVTTLLANKLGMPAPQGVFVIGAPAGGAAAQAGLRAMDVIISADSKTYKSTDELIGYIASKPAGHVLKLNIWRNRAAQDLAVPLANSGPDYDIPKDAAGYCYVLAMPVPMAPSHNVLWISHIFPVADRNNALLTRGQTSGDAFKNYLQQQRVSPPEGLAGYGMCNAGLNNMISLWNAQKKSFSAPAFVATGSEGVELLWKP